MIRLVDISASEVDDSFVASLRDGNPATVVPNISGSAGLIDASFDVEYRDLGSILTDLINRDEEFVEGIELARGQLRRGEVVTYEEVFGD
jgi:hypothetical protein